MHPGASRILSVSAVAAAPDGNLYGVLCGFSFTPRDHLGERGVRRLQMTAGAAACSLAQAEGHHVNRSFALGPLN